MGKFIDFLETKGGGTIASGLLAQGIGMLGENKRFQRNLDAQKQLMDIQNINQRGLNVQGSQLAYDMWKKTNYPAQVEMLKEAGLNPALIYGSAGAGGTTQAGSGGSAAGGNAPNQYQPMDMSNILLAAQARKLDAETKEIEKGTEGIELDNAYKVIENSKLNEKLQTEINEMLSRIDVNNKEAELKDIALKLKENGIHNDFIATLIGATTGWDLTNPGELSEKVQVVPQGLKTLLNEVGIEIEGEMSKRSVMNIAVGGFIAGKIALDKLTDIAGAISNWLRVPVGYK